MVRDCLHEPNAIKVSRHTSVFSVRKELANEVLLAKPMLARSLMLVEHRNSNNKPRLSYR